MKSKTLIILLIMLSIIIPKTTYAQKSGTARFENISVENGLSNDEITCIFQDSRGYIWIGTKDGLNRYDGQIVRQYTYDSKNNNSLSCGYITDIAEDVYGNIWIGTDNGLSVLFYNDDIIKRAGDLNNTYNLGNLKITALLNIKDIMWVGTENGLMAINVKNKCIKSFYNNNNNQNSLTDSYITCLEEDEEGKLWIGTKKGLNIINKNPEIIPIGIKSYQNNNYICDISKDNIGNVWISTKKGIFKYNIRENQNDNIRIIKDNEVIEYDFDTKKINKIHSFKDVDIDIYKNIIYLDSKNNPWFTTSLGAVRYSPNEKKYTNFSKEIDIRYSITSNVITCYFEDSNGTMWIGTDKGVNILNENTIFNEVYLKDNNIVSTLLIDNKIWIATKTNGIYIYDLEYKKIIDNFKINNDYIKKVFKLNDEIIAIVTNENTVYIDITREDYKNVKNVSNDSYGLRYMYCDNENIWVSNENDFFTVDLKTQETNYYSHNLRKNKINPGKITFILPDNKDKDIIWLGGISTGLIKYHKKDGVMDIYKEDFLLDTHTNCMTFDKLGNIWIGTNAGIGKFNINTKEFKLYTTSEGLTNNFINSIIIDDNDNVWISTNNGLNKFDIKNNKLIKFTKIDGLNGYNFNLNSSLKLNNGNLIFGSTNGYILFNPNELASYDKTKNEVVIGDIYIGKNKINYDKELVLEHDYKHLYINYFLPDYNNISNITYEYMLEGIDSEWIYTGHSNSVDFKTLEPGKYTLKIRARDGHGELTKETTMNIKVNKPIWKTNLAYGIYALILISIITLIFNHLRILQRLVDQKTFKLNKQLEENKRLSKEIIEVEKLKNNYFVNLSHELRTPINVIVSTVQLIKLRIYNGNIPYDKLNNYINIISNNCEGLLKIISDILDTSKIETGQYKITKSNNDIVYIVEETALSMSKYIESKGLSLIIDPDMEEQIVLCDEVEIRRCIVNLLGNAVKFTNEGGCITIYIKQIKDNIEITVEDTGIGISKEDQEFIFKRFSQVENTNAIKASSSGIGLSLVKHIAELHGGYVRLESEPNVGSKFTIGIPNIVEKADNV